MVDKKSDLIRLTELLLTAELYNQSGKLGENDLPPMIREHFLDVITRDVRRPIRVTRGDVEKICGLENVEGLAKDLVFVEFETTGHCLRLSDFDAGAEWFASQDSHQIIQSNPTLALYFQKYDPNVSYIDARVATRPFPHSTHAPRGGGDGIGVEDHEPESEPDVLKLVSIKYQDQVRNSLDDLIMTEEQRREIAKAGKAMEHREYLKAVGLYEIGKILFIGPPGTGKTSSARSLSKWFRLPLLEVRLSMIISHYLGETSKNIDRVFVLAKQLSPCIIFIDEFDFVAKTRTSDDHGAIKRAVNTLLKAIDDISLVEDGVLLIAATNYPQLLDYAAWRRFDKILSFSLPDEEMRHRILEKILQKMDAHVDALELARLTDGYTGSDLRLVVREAVLNNLLQDRKRIDQEDLLLALEDFQRRDSDYRQGNVPS